MTTIRLTMAQALVKHVMAQKAEVDGQVLPLITGAWAIFGHGNVAGLGEALYQVRDEFPTLRAHNEQAMAHAAIAFTKARARRQMMACTSSIGPGATNMVTAAALAHVNRLPVLFLPGDTFVTRAPDPVLQQIENFHDPNITVNDCFRPVSRYWDRISRPEQLLTSLPRAIQVLTDPAECGPATLALPQDVQTMAYDYPEQFFAERVHYLRRPEPDQRQLETAAELLQAAQKPLIIAGGGVHYSLACERLGVFAQEHNIPVAETQAGKGALAWNHPCQTGSIGVTGSAAANGLAHDADAVLAVGTRLQDFTTASRSLFANPDCRLISLNIGSFDASKHGAVPLICDAFRGIESLSAEVGDWQAPESWIEIARQRSNEWHTVVDQVTAADGSSPPTDMQVLGAVNRAASEDGIVVCAAGGLPGELHKLWRTATPEGYHLEYGYSCMGYEIAGGLGVKMAFPERDVCVLVGDGSYLMLNSEIATSVLLGHKLVIVVLDNGGFGCIDRLQEACGGASFNNLFRNTAQSPDGAPEIDFAAHAAAMGASSEKVANLQDLQSALRRAKDASKTCTIVIETDPESSTQDGGAWWDVAVPEVSERNEVRNACEKYVVAKRNQRVT